MSRKERFSRRLVVLLVIVVALSFHANHVLSSSSSDGPGRRRRRRRPPPPSKFDNTPFLPSYIFNPATDPPASQPSEGAKKSAVNGPTEKQESKPWQKWQTAPWKPKSVGPKLDSIDGAKSPIAPPAIDVPQQRQRESWSAAGRPKVKDAGDHRDTLAKTEQSSSAKNIPLTGTSSVAVQPVLTLALRTLSSDCPHDAQTIRRFACCGLHTSYDEVGDVVQPPPPPFRAPKSGSIDRNSLAVLQNATAGLLFPPQTVIANIQSHGSHCPIPPLTDLRVRARSTTVPSRALGAPGGGGGGGGGGQGEGRD